MLISRETTLFNTLYLERRRGERRTINCGNLNAHVRKCANKMHRLVNYTPGGGGGDD